MPYRLVNSHAPLRPRAGGCCRERANSADSSLFIAELDDFTSVYIRSRPEVCPNDAEEAPSPPPRWHSRPAREAATAARLSAPWTTAPPARTGDGSSASGWNGRATHSCGERHIVGKPAPPGRKSSGLESNPLSKLRFDSRSAHFPLGPRSFSISISL